MIQKLYKAVQGTLRQLSSNYTTKSAMDSVVKKLPAHKQDLIKHSISNTINFSDWGTSSKTKLETNSNITDAILVGLEVIFGVMSMSGVGFVAVNAFQSELGVNQIGLKSLPYILTAIGLSGGAIVQLIVQIRKLTQRREIVGGFRR